MEWKTWAIVLVIFEAASADDKCTHYGDESVAQAIHDQLRVWEEIYNAGNLDSIKDMYSTNAILSMQKQADLFGNEAIVKWVKNNFSLEEGTTIHIGCEEIIGINGDWGSARTHFQYGSRVERVLLIYIRENDTWRIHRDMINDAPAP